jgi:hypothetical protein
VVIDERGQIEQFSAAAERMFGCPAGSYRHNVRELMPEPTGRSMTSTCSATSTNGHASSASDVRSGAAQGRTIFHATSVGAVRGSATALRRFHSRHHRPQRAEEMSGAAGWNCGSRNSSRTSATTS